MENEIIIYAEDDVQTNHLFDRFLKRNFNGYKIETYFNGKSLEKRLNEDSTKIVVILTDNQMPGIEGSKIIEKYAKNTEFSKIPFILVYGGENKIGEQAVKNGAYSFIKKPITDWKSDYIGKIKEAINSKK